MKVGDLVKYMSRVIIITNVSDDVWVEGIELGETEVGRYKRKVIKEFIKSGDFRQ
tara:strand:+ start:543 stop:707 length:165 start_codon:yes stop_codon:yes gene_type:complete